MGSLFGEGNVLIERFQALDRSSAPFQHQIREACKFVGLRHLEGKDLLSYRLSDDALLLDYNAKDERIFRWLLKKLNDKNAFVQHGSWLLFAQMTTRLPIKTLARLLQRYRLIDILGKALRETLGRLKFPMASTRQNNIRADRIVADAREDILTQHDEPTNTEKRHGSDQSEIATTNSVINGSINVTSLLFSVSLVLEALQYKIDRHNSGPGAFAAQNINYVLQASSLEAAEVLRDGFRLILCSQDEFLLHMPLSSICERIIEPFLKFWQVRKVSNENDSPNTEASIFAKYCLIPGSKLWQGFRADHRAQQLLKALIVSCCIRPYQELTMTEAGAGHTARDRSRAAANELISSSFGNLSREESRNQQVNGPWNEAFDASDATTTERCGTNRGGSVNDLAEDHYNYVPVIFEFAVRTAFSNKQRLGTPESLWINELFRASCELLGANLENPSQSAINEIGSDVLDRLLEVLQSSNHSPGAATLNIILSSLSGLGNTQQEPQWKRARLCIEIDYKVVSDFTQQQSDSQQTQSALPELLDAISMFDEQPGRSELSSSSKRSTTVQLLGCVMTAFTKARGLSEFLSLWERRITAHFESLSDSDLETAGQMVWDSHDLYHEALKKLQLSNTPTQRLSMFERRLKRLQAVGSAAVNVRETYAILFVLSCLFESLARSGNSELSSNIVSDYHGLLFHYQNCFASYPRFGQFLWPLLALVYEEQLRFPIQTSSSNATHELCDSANSDAISCTRSSKTIAKLENGISAAQFLSGMWERSKSMEAIDFTSMTTISFPATVRDLTHCLEVLESGNHKSKWSGVEYSIVGCDSFILAYCVVVLLQASNFEASDSSLAQPFFDGICHLASLSCRVAETADDGAESGGRQSLSWNSIWNSLRRSRALPDQAAASKAFRIAQLHAFLDTADVAMNKSLPPACYKFAIDGLPSLHLPSLSKTNRTNLANVALINFRRAPDSASREILLDILSRLLENANKSMKIVMQPSELFDVAAYLDSTQNVSDNELSILGQLTTAYFESCLQLSDTPASPPVNQIIARAKDEIRGLTDQTSKLATLTVLSSLLSHSQKADYESSLGVGDMAEAFWKSQVLLLINQRTREHFLDRAFVFTLATIASLRNQLADIQLAPSLQAVCDATVPFKMSFWEFFDNLYLDIRQRAELSETQTETAKYLVHRSMASLQSILDFMPGRQRSQHELILYEGSWFQNAGVIKTFAQLDVNEKIKAIRQLTKRSTSPSPSQCSQLYALRKLVSEPSTLEKRDENTKTAMGSVYLTVLNAAQESSSIDIALGHLKIIDAILYKNPWITTQYHIESTFSLITTFTSHSHNLTPNHRIKTLYRTLVSLLQEIFTNLHHRTKTGGRYHLVHPAISALLRCLYTPYPTATTSPLSFAQPTWLRVSPSTSHFTLAEASSWTRLLSTICDPSPSAIKSSRRHQRGPRLNDDTKKAKALAGQHLQYVVQEFCALELQGKITPPECRREVVEQGLYGILDVMGKEVRQVCGDMLEGEEREVYRGLIAGWRRYRGK